MNRTSKTRIGVIGCGAIAELYHLPALADNPRTCRGVALCDPSSQRLDTMQQRFSTTFACQEYCDLVGRVDGVIVATPPHLHYSMCKFFLEQGVPVLCEKPLTETSQEAIELIEMSKATQTALAVNQTRRFFPTYQKIRQLIAEGTLGELRSITYHDGTDFSWPAASPHHFQSGAKGAWSDTGVHLLDSVCYWIDGKPNFLKSQNDSFGGPEAMATVYLEYRGCQIEIKVSRYDRLMNGFHIVGSLGEVQAEAEDWDEFTLVVHRGRKRRFKCASNRLKYNDFAKPMLENFVEVITDGVEPTVSGQSVLGTVQLLEQAYERATRYPMPWNNSLETWSRDRRFQPTSGGSRRVLVTGVSGFVGGRVVEAMQLSELFDPIAAVRNWSRAARVATFPPEITVCDILIPEQVNRAIQNVDAIVHCAYGGDSDSIVRGTKNLLEAAARVGISNFIYLSSAEVYGSQRTGEIAEDVALSSTGNPYGDAKLEAENLCRAFTDKGVFATILRPSLIYGPHGDSWSIDIVERLQSGNWTLFDGLGDGVANLIYVDDMVQAIFLCLRSPADTPRVYNVGGSHPPTWNEYFQKFNDLLGLPPLRRSSGTKSKFKSAAMDVVRGTTSAIKERFEDRLMEIYLRGGFASRMMKRLKNRLDTTPSSGELNGLYACRAIYNDDKIRNDLGYCPQFDLETGIRATIQWMLLHELVKYPDRIVGPKGNHQRFVPSEEVLT